MASALLSRSRTPSDRCALRLGLSITLLLVIGSVFGCKTREPTTVGLETRYIYVNSNIAISPDGKIGAHGNTQGEIILWDTTNLEVIARLADEYSNIQAVAWSSDGKWLAAGRYDSMISVWDVASGTRLHVLEGHFYPVNDIKVSG